MTTLKFNVFGKRLSVVRARERWVAYYYSDDGKRRPAQDIVVPAELDESKMEQYLDDLCHEWATDRHPNVVRLK